MRRLIRAIVDWAYAPIDAPYLEIQANIYDLQEGDKAPVVFCRARPGIPGVDPEHIHQYPYSEADGQRYVDNGWQVSNNECIIPAIPFEEVNGDPAPKVLEVVDVTPRRPGPE